MFHIFLLFSILIVTGCTNKISNKCGVNTNSQALITGSIIGGIASKLSNINPIVGVIVGGIVGAVGGRQLASLQCQYYNKEKSLIQEIQNSVKEQNNLVKKTTSLNKEMTLLYNKTYLLKMSYNKVLKDKIALKKEILLKKEEVLDIQSLNSKVRLSTQEYYNTLNERKYSKIDKKQIKISLNSIFKSLTSIENSCIYNLQQLKKFKRNLN